MSKWLVLTILNFYKHAMFKAYPAKFIDMASQYVDIVYRYQLPILNVSDVENLTLNYTMRELKPEIAGEEKKSNILFVVTKPYENGGHTKLMANLADMVEGDKDLLVSRVCKEAALQRLKPYFSNIEKVSRSLNESSLDFISRLVGSMHGYKKIVLNTSPSDIYSILACGYLSRLDKGVKIYFVNHADHACSFGATIADYWFEISLYGKDLDRIRGVRGKSSFLGIPLKIIRGEESGCLLKEYPNINDINIFLTAGSPHKFLPYNKSSILPLLKEVLSLNPRFTVKIIGPKLKTNLWLWMFYFKYKRRVSIVQSLPYADYIHVVNSADYYIDSSPIPGGTAFAEQFLSGRACTGLKTGYYGYSPLEKFKFYDIQQVISFIKCPPSVSALLEMNKQIIEVHDYSSVRSRFIQCLDEGVVSSNPMLDYYAELKTDIDVPVRYLRILFSRRFIIFKVLFEAFGVWLAFFSAKSNFRQN